MAKASVAYWAAFVHWVMSCSLPHCHPIAMVRQIVQPSKADDASEQELSTVKKEANQAYSTIASEVWDSLGTQVEPMSSRELAWAVH